MERGTVNGTTLHRAYWNAELIGSVRGVPWVIKVKPEALIPYTWGSRHATALVFLATVADEDGLRVIMGEGYIDLKMALDGEKAFSSMK
jgi:hypothetical protein